MKSGDDDAKMLTTEGTPETLINIIKEEKNALLQIEDEN